MDTVAVVMLQTVEDANAWPVEGEDARVRLVPTVDKLLEGRVYALPERQARKLKGMGYARDAREDETAAAAGMP